MSFVFAPGTARAGALLCALIGRDRLGNGNRGSQSNRRESSYCQRLNPSFVHVCIVTPTSLFSPWGASQSHRHFRGKDGYKACSARDQSADKSAHSKAKRDDYVTHFGKGRFGRARSARQPCNQKSHTRVLDHGTETAFCYWK